MGVEAARAALRPLDGVSPHTLWFSTVAPAYADKTNATAIHAALRLGPDVGAFDANGSVRSAMGALHAALGGRGTHLVVSADLRTGLAGRPGRGRVRRRRRRPARRRRATTARCSPSSSAAAGPPRSSSTAGARRATPARRCGRSASARPATSPSAQAAWDDALEDGRAGRRPGRPRRHRRTARPGQRRAGQEARRSATGCVARPGRRRRQPRRRPAGLPAHRGARGGRPGQVIALVVLADGADVLLFRTTDALDRRGRPARPLADQVAGGAPIAVRHLPALAGRAAGRAAPPARAGPAVGVGGGALGGLEVRLRRLVRRRRRGAPAAAAR